jgi:hypothetical protein
MCSTTKITIVFFLWHSRRNRKEFVLRTNMWGWRINKFMKTTKDVRGLFMHFICQIHKTLRIWRWDDENFSSHNVLYQQIKEIKHFSSIFVISPNHREHYVLSEYHSSWLMHLRMFWDMCVELRDHNWRRSFMYYL